MKPIQIQIFSFIIVLGFSVFVSWAVSASVRSTLRQYHAESFPYAQGQVLSGAVRKYTGSKGRVYYRAIFHYRYEVNGQTFESSRYRYDGHPTFGNFNDAEDKLALHPEGSDIPVYYNPANPRDALLSPLVDSQDVAFLFFLIPINFFLFYTVGKLGIEIYQSMRPMPLAGGVKLLNERMVLRIRLPQYQPFTVSVYTALIMSIIAGIGVSIVGEKYTPKTVGGIALAIICIGVGGVYFWLCRKIASGDQDLVIDEATKTMQLPPTYKRRKRLTVLFSDVVEVTLQRVAHQNRSGVTYTYAPTLQLRDGSSQKLTDLKLDRATAFATWLQQKIGLEAAEVAANS
jgi:hypothetical protein